jgi:methyl-accepting chemotaxis protein
MKYFYSLSISNKLLIIILPVLLLSFLLLGKITTQKVRENVKEETIRQLNGTVTSLSEMVNIADKSIVRDADSKMSNLLQHYRGAFALDAGSTMQVGALNAPVLSFNGVPVNLDNGRVDQFSAQNENSVATVFVRQGEEFIRVATSLKKEDGSRALGTALPKDHPAYAQLVRGEIFTGKAKLFGHYYMTKYQPIRDAGNSVVGVLFIGTNIDDIIERLRATVSAIKVGKSGYAYVLDVGKLKTNGEFVMHPDKANVGKNVMGFKDSRGKEFFKEMAQKKNGYVTYWWKNSGESAEREKFAIFMTIPVWEWLIACSGYQDELYATANSVQNFILVASLLFAAVLGVIIVTAIRKFLAPLQDTASFLEQIAAGDFSVRPEITTGGEIGAMQHACLNMVTRLNETLRSTADNAGKVAAAARQMHGTSELMAAGAEEAAAQTMTVATAGEEMAATSGDIARSCMVAAEGSRRTNETALEGARVVESTVVVMARIAERVKASSETVASLGTRSEQIGTIISTIQEIADQTNLLALNAAIEAARAGEQGRGFAVVADEVRALAERTTRATREIDAMIKAIQNDTRLAVSAMQEGVSEVETGTGEATRSGKALESILDQINTVTMQISQIATAAEEQTATTNEISGNMQQITEAIRTTSSGAQESAAAASHLAGLSEELQRLVGQFKLAP